jgi:hypothetical protein
MIMEIIFMYIAGVIVFVIASLAIINGVVSRVKRPIDNFRVQISELETRVSELENRDNS